MAAGDEIDAGGDHGGRVNEGRNGRGTFHGIRQPNVEGNLRGFPGGSEDEQKADAGEDAALHGERKRIDFGEYLSEVERAEVGDEEKHGEQKAEVADAVDDKGFLAGVGGGVALEVEADQQVGGKADALPADEEQEEAGGKDEDQHEEHEEVEVGEEAPVPLFVRHVADGVDVDEEADAGDDGEHDEGEVVDGEREVHLEAGDRDPGAAHGLDRSVAGAEQRGPEPDHKQRRQRREKQRDGRDAGARQPAAECAVQHEAGKGKRGDEPEERGIHAIWGLGGVDFVGMVESGFPSGEQKQR